MKLYDQCLAMAVGVCFGALQTALAQPPAYDTHATQLDHPRYRVSVLRNIPMGTYTVPLAINNAGQVLGWAFDQGVCNPLGCGAVWTELEPTLLGTVPHALFTRPVAFNDHGQSVGLIYFKGPDDAAITPPVGIHYPFKAVVWNGTEPTLLPSLPADWSATATSINNEGEIVGYSEKVTVGQRGLIWHDAKPRYVAPCTYQPLVNDEGQIVCWTASENDPLVFISGGTVTDLPQLAGGDSTASAINDSGQIVGSSASRAGVGRATYWHQDKIAVLHSSHTEYSSANGDGINSQGNIVGYATTAKGRQYAALWPETTSEPVDLNTVISQSDAAEVTLSEAVGINDKCEIAVAGHDNHGKLQSYVLTLTEGNDCGP
jgi:probable HAF family extracellular repeat protein